MKYRGCLIECNVTRYKSHAISIKPRYNVFRSALCSEHFVAYASTNEKNTTINTHPQNTRTRTRTSYFLWNAVNLFRLFCVKQNARKWDNIPSARALAGGLNKVGLKKKNTNKTLDSTEFDCHADSCGPHSLNAHIRTNEYIHRASFIVGKFHSQSYCCDQFIVCSCCWCGHGPPPLLSSIPTAELIPHPSLDFGWLVSLQNNIIKCVVVAIIFRFFGVVMRRWVPTSEIDPIQCALITHIHFICVGNPFTWYYIYYTQNTKQQANWISWA